MKNTSKLQAFLPLLLPALALLVILASCHKESNKTIVQGHITEYGSGKPLPGARIYLWCSSGEIFGPTNSSFVDSLVPDAQGYFHAAYIDRDLCGGIYLSAYKEGYFYKEDIDIHSGVNDLEIVLDPMAWVTIRTIPSNGIDHLSVGGDFLGASGYEVFSNDGTQDKTFETRGGRFKHIFWRPWGQFDKTVKDSIFLLGLDTTIYTIHY